VRNTGNALHIRFESEAEKRRSSATSEPVTKRRILLEETMENRFNGSIYHPNLVDFDIDVENGLDHRREESPPTSTGKFTTGTLNRFHISSQFLREKPYAFSLLADKGREVQNREFFERETIDSTRYGGIFGLKEVPIPASFSFNSTSQTITRVSRSSQKYDDDKVDLSLSNESDKMGATRLSLSQDKFVRTESDAPDQRGVTKDLRLSNRYLLFGDEDKRLNSSLDVYQLSGSRQSKYLDFKERLDVKHDEHLTSSYAYDLADRSSGGSNSRDNRFNVGLRHRLYDSLNSYVNLHYFNTTGSSLTQDIYGVTSDVDYTKKLGKIGSVWTGAGLTFDEETINSNSNAESVFSESHTLTTGEITLLNRANVDNSSVVVTDSAGTITYVVNLDYQLIALGDRLQVQRLPGGGIANGAQVFVDYRVLSTPSSQFNTLFQRYRAGMDFMDSLFGFAYRVNREGHSGAEGEEGVNLQTLRDNVFSTYAAFHRLRLEWEVEDYNSNFSRYTRQSTKESWSYNPFQRSTYTLQASQNNLRLISSGQTQRYYDLINRYSVILTSASRLSLEAGYRRQKGEQADLEDWTSRSSLEVSLRQFLVTIEYDYENQKYLGEELINHYFFTKIKRAF